MRFAIDIANDLILLSCRLAMEHLCVLQLNIYITHRTLNLKDGNNNVLKYYIFLLIHSYLKKNTTTTKTRSDNNAKL
jgi:hypothetical protein